MQPHQERVVQEKKELDEKILKLSTFLEGTIIKKLPQDEQERLAKQLEYMQAYSGVLEERIKAFPEEKAA